MTVREWCPVGELAGDPHTYVAGDGVVIPWDVAGDPRPGVEVCKKCAPTTCEECNGAIVASRPGEPTPYVHLEDRGCLNSEIVPAP